LVPFIQGRSFLNSPEELIAPQDVFRAGKALAAFLSISQSYPEAASFDDFEFGLFVDEINRIAANKEGLARLGYMLSEHQLQERDAAEKGRAYIAEMKEFGQYLLHCWHKLRDVESAFKSALIHGDLFTDNTMIDESGRFILLDFSETRYGSMGLDLGISLNSWASQNGLLVMENVINFLRAFDRVIPFNADAISLIPVFAQIGAYRWETFRIQRLEMQDPRQQSMRSPEEFQSLRYAWREVQALFDGARSVQELA
jgi:Ser/Thr protein kinase RdoA (MazF antagonist)